MPGTASLTTTCSIPLVHVLHHRFVLPRPTTLFAMHPILFAMHPIEVFGFGAMWLTALVVFTAVGFPLTAAGIGIYVAVNLLVGTMGHVGVEPLPDRLRRSWLFRWVATPSFHVGHHLDPRSNMGFYSTVWDRMFGTLASDYDAARAEPPVLQGRGHDSAKLQAQVESAHQARPGRPVNPATFVLAGSATLGRTGDVGKGTVVFGRVDPASQMPGATALSGATPQATPARPALA